MLGILVKWLLCWRKWCFLGWNRSWIACNEFLLSMFCID